MADQILIPHGFVTLGTSYMPTWKTGHSEVQSGRYGFNTTSSIQVEPWSQHYPTYFIRVSYEIFLSFPQCTTIPAGCMVLLYVGICGFQLFAGFFPHPGRSSFGIKKLCCLRPSGHKHWLHRVRHNILLSFPRCEWFPIFLHGTSSRSIHAAWYAYVTYFSHP